MDPSAFDPDAPGDGDGLFGLPHTAEQAKVWVIPVGWEATTSYGKGTRRGPEAVREASLQVDLYDLDFGDAWRKGIVMLPARPEIAGWGDEAEKASTERLNELGASLNDLVYSEAQGALKAGRIPAVLGGDHSVPYGLHKAVAERFPGVGVLHVDAHADLRVAYRGHTWSHASIMHNTLGLAGVSKLVGVGYRDVGSREVARIQAEPERIRAFFDSDLARRQGEGEPWSAVGDEIVAALPPQVMLSIDIDGLDPTLCPHTGTPVPGGLSFRELMALVRQVALHRHIVAFDLCEVAPGPEGEWDANVGARVFYKLALAALHADARTV